MKASLLEQTPLMKIFSLWIKREDLNPSGSVKDRAITSQLKQIKRKNFTQVAISSSGNAGISLAYWAIRFGVTAHVFLSPRTNPAKIEKLKKLKANLFFSPRPISDCFRFCRQNHALDLRQSKDPSALRGYGLLGDELATQLQGKNINRAYVFFPVSSGSTLLGTTRGLCQKGILVKPIIVQPASFAPLASIWQANYTPEKEKITDALVAKLLPLKKEIIKTINGLGGTGLVIKNQQIQNAQERLRSKQIYTSNEGALAFAAAEQFPAEQGWSKVCLFTGCDYQKND